MLTRYHLCIRKDYKAIIISFHQRRDPFPSFQKQKKLWLGGEAIGTPVLEVTILNTTTQLDINTMPS